MWRKTIKEALKQVRSFSRHALDAVEEGTGETFMSTKQLDTFDNYKDAVIAVVAHTCGTSNFSCVLRALDIDIPTCGHLLSAKAAGKAEEKLESCNLGEGPWAYVHIHVWFTRTTNHGRSMQKAKIMTPTKCDHEHDIFAAIERWEEQCRTLCEDDREALSQIQTR